MELIDRTPIAKKIGEVLKTGHIPCNEEQTYEMFSYSNGMEYACFNFPKKVIQSFKFENDPVFSVFSPFGGFDSDTKEETETKILGFLKQTGLEVEKDSGKPLKPNQWKVAMYTSDAYRTGYGLKSSQFLLREKDETWSGLGWPSGRVTKYAKLEETLPFQPYNKYTLHKIFVITNPYAEKQAEEKQRGL